MHREPWFHCWRPKDDASSKAIGECLRAAGIRVRALDANAPPGEGILCFSQFNDELYEFLREVSHNRYDRVLAIPTANTVIDASSVWELLRAGASDVLVWSADI